MVLYITILYFIYLLSSYGFVSFYNDVDVQKIVEVSNSLTENFFSSALELRSTGYSVLCKYREKWAFFCLK